MATEVAGGSSSSSSSSPWGLRSHLPWPAARGEKLWSQFTSADDTHGFAQYEVELCEPSAGHIALVLVKKHASSTGTPAAGTPVATPVAAARGGGVDASPAKGRRGSAPWALLAAHVTAVSPCVVYVVDAIPPRRKATSPARPQQRSRPSASLSSLSPSSASSTISSSNGTLASETTATASNGLQQQDVDEVDLIDELFAAPKAGKDGSILAKSPILCARFDCKVVAIKFMRGNTAGASSSTSSGSFSKSQQRMRRASSSTLRCVVAREDGMAYLWEWGADLHQWTFLNSFCFLENPNLKWTKPVVAFTATEMAWHGETTEFAWWSMESKQEPKLCLRKIQYEQEKNTFRTEITIGNPFSLHCAEVIDLKSSKLGLWIVTKASGVHFRSAASLRTLSLSWHALLGRDAHTAAAIDPTTQVLTCWHNVTGELLVLVRATGAVHLVTPKDQQQGLKSTPLTTLSPWSPNLADSVLSLAGHRHLIFALTREKMLAFSYLTGQKLTSIALPAEKHQDVFHRASMTGATTRAFGLWTITGAASSAGLWSSKGFWFVLAPSAKDIGSVNNSIAQQPANPKAAFEALTNYGESLKFDTALYALEILEKAAKSLDSCDQKAWQTAFAAISSPALLLATFADENAPEQLLDELSRLVSSIYQSAHDIMTTGRFTPSPLEKSNSAKTSNDGLAARRLTPANIEALHHLSNWVLLAKRKTTRLQTSAYFKGRHHLRPRAVSALTTASDGSGVVSSSSSSPLSPLESSDPNFRLSRKLRPMSSLRFASGSCSLHHGKQWLVQLESFLLEGVAFKKQKEDPKTTSGSRPEGSDHPAVPSHLLFHEERRLEDYRSSNSSFSKHMYLESMSRLYLLHEPESLLPFVTCVSEYCPRIFSLSGVKQVSRTHAERALALFPPLQFFIDKFEHEKHQLRHVQVASAASSKSSIHQSQSEKKRKEKQQRQAEVGIALAKESLLAYADLLCRCGYYLEASHGLLQCDLYEQCKEKLLVHAHSQERAEQQEQQETVRSAVYFSLLEYCIKHRDVEELQSLLRLKPAHVSTLHVLRALRNHLPQKASQQHVTVGNLRPVLLALLQQQRAEAQAAGSVGPGVAMDCF